MIDRPFNLWIFPYPGNKIQMKMDINRPSHYDNNEGERPYFEEASDIDLGPMNEAEAMLLAEYLEDIAKDIRRHFDVENLKKG